MKCWRTIQNRLPRVATEMKEALVHLRFKTFPRQGLLEDQPCRFVSLLDWLMMVGALRNGC